MTAKEKATELVSKYVGISLSQVNELVDGIRIRLAKESAKICVDECIKLADLMDGGFSFDKEIDFLQDVKSEIDAL